MHILTHISTPCTIFPNRHGTTSKTLAPSSATPFGIEARKSSTFGASLFVDPGVDLGHRGKNVDRVVVSAAEEGNADAGGAIRKRKVVEHLCLVKAKDDLSGEQEKDMLDYLYTTQYQMRGIVAISLGRICDENPEQYTHAMFMRFQTKEELAKFYENPLYIGVLKEHVMPYCHEFNCGIELVLLLEFIRSSLGGPAEDAVASLINLAMEFPSLIVQATQGPNMNAGSIKEYTHGVVIRFRSSEAFKIFMSSSEYNIMWKSKFEPIIEKSVSLHFSVDPIGTELM